MSIINLLGNFFEGFYIKVTGGEDVCAAVIFGRQKCKGEKSSFIQVLTDESSVNINFDYAEFRAAKKPFSVKIGKNTAGVGGMTLDIDEPGVKISGSVTFGEFTPIKYNAMGPFKFFPLMECKHRVVSMDHAADGKIAINGRELNFKNARGYIEGDCGRSFPKKYFWTQCNLFKKESDLAIMASCARIPYLGLKFTGTICIIHHKGREFRLATYLGACLKVFSKNKLVIKQGRKVLEISVRNAGANARNLSAPVRGKMDRTIRESIKSSASYKFSIGKKVIFDVESDFAAVEFDESR